MIQPGSIVTLDIEKPAAGGRMLARHHGQVVLVWGAIPGERVTARVERTTKQVAFASTLDVVAPSPDRRAVSGDARCGGSVLAHVAYDRQRQLKGEIIQDTFRRIGRVPLERTPEVMASPERGYRMRSRLHVVNGRLGFFREESHELCDAASTGQLLDATSGWVAGSYTKYDKFKGAGNLYKRQFNAKIVQPIGEGKDFISVAVHYNVNRNNNYYSPSLSALANPNNAAQPFIPEETATDPVQKAEVAAAMSVPAWTDVPPEYSDVKRGFAKVWVPVPILVIARIVPASKNAP